MEGGKLLAHHLEKKKIGPVKCAQILGVKYPTVWRWIHGKSKPTGLARIMLKEKLGFEWRD
jgi:DNA-binding transcriptional regulator YiaG